MLGWNVARQLRLALAAAPLWRAGVGGAATNGFCPARIATPDRILIVDIRISIVYSNVILAMFWRRLFTRLASSITNRSTVPVACAVMPSTIGENTLPPYHFTLPAVDSTLLNQAGSTYSIQASIALRTSIRFQDSKAYTPGSTAPIAMSIHPATGHLPYTASGDGWLLLGLILASLAGILAGWRWLRVRPLTRQPQLA